MELAKVVNINGKIVNTINEGDRIIRKKSVDHLDLTIEINVDEPFVKVFTKKIFELSRSLSGSENQFVNVLIYYIRYESGLLAYDNGRALTNKSISKEIGKDIRTIERWMKTLITKEVLIKVNNEYFANPFLFTKGKRVSKTLFEMFKNSRWAK